MGAKVPENKSSRELSFPGAKVPVNELASGAKEPRNELTRVLLANSLQGQNWPGREKARYLKTHHYEPRSETNCTFNRCLERV